MKMLRAHLNGLVEAHLLLLRNTVPVDGRELRERFGVCVGDCLGPVRCAATHSMISCCMAVLMLRLGRRFLLRSSAAGCVGRW